MPRPKIAVIGALIVAADGGLLFLASFRSESEKDWDTVFKLEKSLAAYHGGTAPRSQSLEALPNAYNWPGLGEFPSEPKYDLPGRHLDQSARARWKAEYDAAKEDFARASEAYAKRLHADENYRKSTAEFLANQRREPQILCGLPGRSRTITCWFYRDKIVRVDESQTELPLEDIPLLVKHHLLRQERNYERIRREVEALENMEKLAGTSREPIPESVRLFVWQRDKGQCVKCGAHEKLEFDHIIPVVSGGSNTERNIQLLCETCNRSKGSTI